MATNPIKVNEVFIKSYKCLKDFQQNFNGQSVIISGKNELGKSSILGFISILLGNDDAIPPDTFGKGEIKIVKDGKEYTLKGEINDGKAKVIVCCDGLEDKRKGTLVSLIGANSFDPFKFVEQSKTSEGRKEQIKSIKKLLPQEVQDDLARYEADVKAKYEERTNLGRDLKTKQGFIKQHALYFDSENLDKYNSVDVTELQQKKEAERTRLNELYKKNKAHNDRLREDWNKSKAEIDKQCKEHNEAQLQNIKIKHECLNAHKVLTTYGYNGFEVVDFIEEKTKAILKEKIASELYPAEPTYIPEMPDDKELQDIDALILSASEKNSLYKDAKDLQKKMDEVKSLEDNIADLTVSIELGRQSIADAIKECATIIDGLSFNDETILLNDIPLASISTSQKIQLAYQLKSFENPNVPLMVECIESMDDEKYNAMIEFSKANNVQIFGEEVKRGVDKLEFHFLKAE